MLTWVALVSSFDWLHLFVANHMPYIHLYLMHTAALELLLEMAVRKVSLSSVAPEYFNCRFIQRMQNYSCLVLLEAQLRYD